MASPHRHGIYPVVEVKLVNGSRGFSRMSPTFSQETHKVSKITKTHKPKETNKKSYVSHMAMAGIKKK